MSTTRTQTAAASLYPDREFGGEEMWHVLHVLSRQEKALAGMLGGMGVRCYVPILEQVTYHGKRKTLVKRPLFPGYAFLWGTRDQAFEADRTRKVANLISVTDQGYLEWELQNIHRALATNARLEPHDPLKEGTRVRVRSGPFRDLEGVVRKNSRENLLILQVAMLGSAASLTIDRSLLVPLD